MIKKLLSVSMVGVTLAAPCQQPGTSMQQITVATGIPLHIKVNRTAKLSAGTKVEGVLLDPIYVGDRLVIPAGASVRGVVTGITPAAHQVRLQALLDGDVTPLHEPVVDFNTLRLPQLSYDIQLDSHALIRDTQIVRFDATSKKHSIFRQVKSMVSQRVHDTREAIFAPGKKDRALRLLYSQLPYHPQRIWAGTQFIADLNAPATITLPTEPPARLAINPSLNGLKVTARLEDSIDSSTAIKGTTVKAIVIQPIFDSSQNLILPEGAMLEGSILHSKPARSFGRNGELRFDFRRVDALNVSPRKVDGMLTGAAGSNNQNLTVDEEGNVKANPDKNRFVAPLLLGVLAVAGSQRDDDGNGLGRTTVASNGFGLIARIVALTANNRAVATSFGGYAFAKSIYFRFLTRGHEVTFPKDTLVEVQLFSRQ